MRIHSASFLRNVAIYIAFTVVVNLSKPYLPEDMDEFLHDLLPTLLNITVFIILLIIQFKRLRSRGWDIFQIDPNSSQIQKIAGIKSASLSEYQLVDEYDAILYKFTLQAPFFSGRIENTKYSLSLGPSDYESFELKAIRVENFITIGESERHGYNIHCLNRGKLQFTFRVPYVIDHTAISKSASGDEGYVTELLVSPQADIKLAYFISTMIMIRLIGETSDGI